MRWTKAFSVLFALSLVWNSCFASCDFSTVERQGNKFIYSAECHKKVYKLIQEAKKREEQVEELNKTIKLKDLAIDTHMDRAEKWRKTSYELEDRVITMQKIKKYNDWLYFGLGFLAAGLAVYGAGQLK